jgi:hypothetical protein
MCFNSDEKENKKNSFYFFMIYKIFLFISRNKIRKAAITFDISVCPYHKAPITTRHIPMIDLH